MKVPPHLHPNRFLVTQENYPHRTAQPFLSNLALVVYFYDLSQVEIISKKSNSDYWTGLLIYCGVQIERGPGESHTVTNTTGLGGSAWE